MIGLDVDGTLLDYAYSQQGEVNRQLIESIKGPIALISNQGGISLGVEGKVREDGRPYPTPQVFATRFATLMAELGKVGIEVACVRVCVYHPRASTEAIKKAREEVLSIIKGYCRDAKVFTTIAARKPAPYMLRESRVSAYYGDGDEDEQAAQAAGVEFIRVDRLMGSQA